MVNRSYHNNCRYQVSHDHRPAHSRGLSEPIKPIKPTGQALTLINPFHKRHYYIILTLQKMMFFLSNQIMGLYHFSNPIEKPVHLWWKIVHLWWKISVDYLRHKIKERVNLLGMPDWP